jgi:hypothetical protein
MSAVSGIVMALNFSGMTSCSNNLSREQRICKKEPQKHPRTVGIIFPGKLYAREPTHQTWREADCYAADVSRTKRLRVVMRDPELGL